MNNGADKALLDNFDYDEYAIKKNQFILNLAFTKYTFSVKDSEYYVAHPFDKLSNVSSKEYDEIMETGSKYWYTDHNFTKIDEDILPFKTAYISK